ncbi:MAG: hypothetical protein KJT01_16535, partial [Gemmatimonadetes bacterium]|nr:hypothetical protein [Gemmatimonadota bacterium]
MAASRWPFVPRVARAVAAAVPLLLALPAGLRAQGDSASVRLALQGVRPVQTMRNWPGATFTVGRDAHVAVFAVSRGRDGSLPLEVLAPARPDRQRPVRRGAPVRLRALERDELLHVAVGADAPLLVAFASTMPPFLAPFSAGHQWARQLVLDTAVVDVRELVATLGAVLYPPGTPYEVVTSSASLPIQVNARLWWFDDECQGYATRFRDLGGTGLGLLGAQWPRNGMPWNFLLPVSAMPSILPAAMGSLFMVPVVDPSVPGCHGYRVAWTPSAVPDATLGRAPGAQPSTAGVMVDELQPRPPRYPGRGELLTLDTAWRPPVERPEEATRGAGVSQPDGTGAGRAMGGGWSRVPPDAEERSRRRVEDTGVPVERTPIERTPATGEERNRRRVDDEGMPRPGTGEPMERVRPPVDPPEP